MVHDELSIHINTPGYEKIVVPVVAHVREAIRLPPSALVIPVLKDGRTIERAVYELPVEGERCMVESGSASVTILVSR